MTDTAPTLAEGWQTEARAHWDKIRAAIPPFRFPPQAPSIFLDLSSDEATDIARFRTRRQITLADYATAMARYRGKTQ